jgi:ankyrin repeat protein
MQLSTKRRDDTQMKAVFEQYKDLDGGLSKNSLMRALKAVAAPVLISGNDTSEDSLYLLADNNADGFVDLSEFKRIANLPDQLDMFLGDHGLSCVAPALRAHVGDARDQIGCLASLAVEQLDAAASASMTYLKQTLRRAQQQLQVVKFAEEKIRDQLDKEPGKYQIRKMEVGSIDDFHKGLTHRIGSPNLRFEKTMFLEHCIFGGSSYEFTTPNYNVKTTPLNEWQYICGDDKCARVPCPDMGYGRRIVSIEELLQIPLARKAKLTRAEVIAVVLYTGPMFVVYNGILRRFPENLYEVFCKSNNLFSTTIFVLVSAVQKLSRCMRIPSDMLLYRGLGGLMQLPDSFSQADANGCKGFTEFGFMSTTADRSVAVQYSGVMDGKPQASIMEIHPNSVDRGADISEFSQYPAEREFLFVPMSFVQGEGRCRLEIGPGGGVLKVISVRININIKTETVEQLMGKKKSMHLSAFKSLIDETNQWMQAYAAEDGRALARAATDKEYGNFDIDISSFISEIMNQMRAIMNADEALPDDDYVNDLKYKALVTRMLSAQDWSKQKLNLWLQNPETNIFDLVWTPLKSAHRQWLSFLKQRQYSIAGVGSDHRQAAAVKILQCKGLMVTDNALTEAVDGEPLIYAAAADGWALEDLRFLIDAGAILAAVNSNRDSAVHATSENGDALALEALVKAGADVNQLNLDGLAPAHLAAQGGHAPCVDILVTMKADVNIQNRDGRTPIHFAAQGGHISCIELLVTKFEVDVNVKDIEDGLTPMHLAAERGHAPCIELLVAMRANVNAQGNHGTAPLHFAAKGHPFCIELLVTKFGADLNLRNDNGWTAVFVAVLFNSPACIPTLVQLKADITICSGDGKTPLEKAKEQGFSQCVAALEAAGAN